jgi:hypothetical protein
VLPLIQGIRFSFSAVFYTLAASPRGLFNIVNCHLPIGNMEYDDENSHVLS